MQAQSFLDAERWHIGLMIGQYVILPLALWAAHSYKRSIINEMKHHVDTAVNGKFKDLSNRIGRIEDVLLRRSSAARRPSGASGRTKKG